MKRYLFLSAVMLAVGTTVSVQAALVAYWDFNSIENAPIQGQDYTVPANADPGGLAFYRGGTVATFGFNDAESTTLNRPAEFPDSVAGLALAAFNPANVNPTILLVTVPSATGLGFQSLSYAVYSTGTTPITEQWQYSDDNGGSWNDIGPVMQVADTYSTHTLNLAGITITADPVSGNVLFRNQVSFTAPENDSISFDNLQITAVPEPIHMALVTFGFCAVGVGFGRRVYTRIRS